LFYGFCKGIKKGFTGKFFEIFAGISEVKLLLLFFTPLFSTLRFKKEISDEIY